MRIALLLLAAAQFDLNRTVDQALDQWQKNTHIVMTQEASQTVKRDVGDAWPRLEPMSKLQAPYEKSPEPLVETLVRAYCFDLRDAKLRERRPAGPHALHLQPSGPVRIETDDVRKFSFLDFIGQFFPRLEPVGYLEVASQPEQAGITIDKQPKGFTDRVFVLSTGSHTVGISSESAHLRCTHTVRIAAGRKAAVRCP